MNKKRSGPGLSGTTLTDRQQIYDLQVRYGRCVDTHDHDGLIRTCYTDDVVVQYDPVGGQGRPLVGWDEFVRVWDNNWPPPWDNFHQFTNFTFEIDGDEGAYSCLGLAQHWPRKADFSGHVPLFTVGLRYENRVRRTRDGWRIVRQHNITLWTSGDPQVCAQFLPNK